MLFWPRWGVQHLMRGLIDASWFSRALPACESSSVALGYHEPEADRMSMRRLACTRNVRWGLVGAQTSARACQSSEMSAALAGEGVCVRP